MALNFPASPTNGQQYTDPNGVVWEYSSTPGVWEPLASVINPTVLFSDTAPTIANYPNGVLWHKTDDGDTYIAYQDVSGDRFWLLQSTPITSVVDDTRANTNVAEVVTAAWEFSSGIYLGGSVSANLLNDYEEGTFTPGVYDSDLSGKSQTYANQTGLYIKVGRVVHIQGRIAMSSLGTLTTGSALFLADLPFTAVNNGSARGVLSIGYHNNLSITAGLSPSFLLSANTTYAVGYLIGGAATSSGMTVANLTASGDIYFSGTYRTT
jgi:hypothetical protein